MGCRAFDEFDHVRPGGSARDEVGHRRERQIRHCGFVAFLKFAHGGDRDREAGNVIELLDVAVVYGRVDR